MSAAESFIIDGYDVLAETGRLAQHARFAAGPGPNRATALLAGEAPAAEASGPRAGQFVAQASGVVMDLGAGVGPRLLDEPLARAAGAAAGRVERHSASDLAALAERSCARDLPALCSCRALVTADGAAAAELGLDLARRHARRRFVERHGIERLLRVRAELGLPADGGIDPFLMLACEGSAHGRSLSAPPAVDGLDTERWVATLPFGGDPSAFEARLDSRPLEQLLTTPGALRASLDAGRWPVDLVGALVIEIVQASGSCRLADGRWVREVARTCDRHGVLLCCDETLGFGRTGRLFAVEHTGVTPDILWMAREAGPGVTMARGDLVDQAVPAVAIDGASADAAAAAWSTWHLLSEHRDEALGGRGYLQNSRIKGEYLRMRLAELSATYPDVFPEFTGLGGVWGLTVALRDAVLDEARRQGLLLTACGPQTELATLRIHLLADVLTHEIDQLVAALDRVFAAVESKHPEL